MRSAGTDHTSPSKSISSQRAWMASPVEALLRLKLYVISVFRCYCCKLTVAKFARQQRADLIKLFPIFGIKLVEFCHCSNPLVGGSTPVRYWSFPQPRNSQLEIKVPTRRHESQKEQWIKRLCGERPMPQQVEADLFSEASYLTARKRLTGLAPRLGRWSPVG